MKERKRIGIERLCQWAFGDEGAELDPSFAEQIGWSTGGLSMEAVLMNRAKLGTKIDGTGPGFFGGRIVARDADAVAAVVRGCLEWRVAVSVAERGRAGTRPAWVPDVEPQVVPVEWHGGPHGWTGKTEPALPGSKFPGGVWREWMSKPTLRACRQNGWDLTPHEIDNLRYLGRCTPVTIRPTLQMINSCRIEYVTWWNALHTVREHLSDGGVLRDHELTKEMPPDMPWLAAGQTGEGMPEHRKGTRTPWG